MYGRILEIICSKQGNKRGQAFIVFSSIESAKRAKEELNGFVFIDKVLRIEYAKSKSDVIAKMDGSYEEHVKKRKLNKEYKSLLSENNRKRRKMENAKPTKILMVGNLPDEVRNNQNLLDLFKNNEGCVDVKYSSEKHISFLFFENEFFATKAKNSLDGFRFYENELEVSYTSANNDE